MEMTLEEFDRQFKYILENALKAIKKNLNIELKAEDMESSYSPLLLNKYNIKSPRFRFTVIFPDGLKRSVGVTFNKGGYVDVPEGMCNMVGLNIWDDHLRSLSKPQQNIVRMSAWLYHLCKDKGYA